MSRPAHRRREAVSQDNAVRPLRRAGDSDRLALIGIQPGPAMPSRRGEPPAPPVCEAADRAPISGSRLDALAEILVNALATPPNEAKRAHPGIAKAGADRRRRGNALPQRQIGQPHGSDRRGSR